MFTHFKKLNILTLTFIVLFALACSAPPASPTTAPTLVPPQPTLIPVQPTTAPTPAPVTNMTLTDGMGRQVTLTNVPTRIVSLAPSNTEIVCALNACDKLIGIDQFSDYPAQVTTLPKLSDGFNPNYEQIIAAKPDLILVAAISSPDVLKKFDELGVPALAVGGINSSFESVKQDIQLVGQALGAQTQANQIIAAMDKKIAAVQAKIANAKSKPRVFWELDATDPAKPFTPGPGTFIHEIILLAGGENIAGNAASPYVQINTEEVIRADPQVIIMSDAAYGVPPESVGERPGWNVITAVKENKVFPIDDNLVSRPGPRVAEGLEAAAKLIHPEVFE